jgi:hypothetical protein
VGSLGSRERSPSRSFGSDRAVVNEDQSWVLAAKGGDGAVVADDRPALGARVILITGRELVALPAPHNHPGLAGRVYRRRFNYVQIVRNLPELARLAL